MSVAAGSRSNALGLLLQRAVASFQRGSLAEAEALCQQILRTDPRHVDALHLRGLAALQAGNVEQAVASMRQSLAIAHHQPVVHTNLANALLQAGKPLAALLSCDTALAQRPGYAEALNARGNALLALKRADEALAAYEHALASRPDLAQFHSNRGNALRELGRAEDALASYQRALRLQPALREALVGSAQALRALQRPQEALPFCERALMHAPQDVEALHERARSLMDLKRPVEAVADLDRARALRPEAAGLALERGNALCQLGRLDEALAAYQNAQQISPADPDVLFNQGNVLLLLQRHEPALACYDQAIALHPDDAKTHHYRGKTLRTLRRPEQALAAFGAALALEPRRVESLNGRGHALVDLDRLAEALVCYEQALGIDPECLEAMSHRGQVLLASGRVEEAAQCLERLLEIEPETGAEFNYTLGRLLHARLMACDWRNYEATTAAIENGLQDGRRVTGPSLYTASGLSPELHLRCARRFVEDNWGHLAPVCWTGPLYRHDRIRVAYVSADFCEHPVSMLMAGIFEQHDRSRFEPVAVAIRGQDQSALARRVRGAFERFIDVTGQTDGEVAALLRELEVDVCVDLTGYTANLRSGIFAHRAAPIQVNYLGYAGTLGAGYMDYIIADPIVIPHADQGHYSEAVAYLPHSYLPPGDRRGVVRAELRRVDCGLPDRGVVFCGFNAHSKIAPPIFDVWMRLLHAVEGSVLWLSMGTEAVTRNLTREAASLGIAPDRIVFAPRLPELEMHLARYRLADLFLDTLPYNAHTTASDALWAGLPVLSCRGTSFPGRVAAGLLTALGLPELITDGLDEYETRALELVADSGRLSELRARLVQARDTHELFDAGRFCRYLESAYVRMWERSQRGEPPASFHVAAGT